MGNRMITVRTVQIVSSEEQHCPSGACRRRSGQRGSPKKTQFFWNENNIWVFTGTYVNLSSIFKVSDEHIN